MARPKKERQVTVLPQVRYFKPAGIPMRFIEEVALTVDEAEALHLSDVEDFSQNMAALQMNISRATYQRILESAHNKVADAIFNGKAIRIEGGSYGIFKGQNKIEIEGEKMKFCIPACDGKLNPHFGQSREFIMIEAEDGQIISKTVVNPVESGCHSLPQLLMDNKVQVLICGGIGAPPMQALQSFGIRVVPGVTESDPEKAVLGYINGTIVPGVSSCADHDGHHDGCCH